MSEWVSSTWMDAEVVTMGERPGVLVDSAIPLSPEEAASYVSDWFPESNQSAACGLILAMGGDLRHLLSIYQIQDQIRDALLSGRLIAYPVGTKHLPTPDDGGPRRRPVTSQPTLPSPKSPRPSSTVDPTHFMVRWVDELGEAIADLEVVFSISGTRHKAKTDREGIARYTDSGGSGFAWVEPGDLDTLREMVKPRWDTIRDGGREGEVLTDGDAHVVMLRAPTEGVSLVAEELETVSVQPYVERVRLLGEHFEASKAFLVPEGLAGARAILGNRARLKVACLHIVGHTDTSADAAYNDKLSLERAESLKDYLTQNVDGWLAWYEAGIAHEKRWGAKEDLLMIDAMVDYASRSATEPAVRWYQRTRGLTVDNIAGPITRAKLIAEYMALSGKPLPASVAVTTHGCGESFPRSETGDGVANDDNRRVEAYFFASELGVQPPAPGFTSKPGSPEYPEWVRRSRRTEDHGVQVIGNDDFIVPPQKAEPFVVEEIEAPQGIASIDQSTDPLLPYPPTAYPPYTAIFVEGPAKRPIITFDHGFLDDGTSAHNLDITKMEPPTAKDTEDLAKWVSLLKLAQASPLGLREATDQYEHYLYGNGAATVIDYKKYLDFDDSGRVAMASLAQDLMHGAARIYATGGSIRTSNSTFHITSYKSISIGGRSNYRYPYPASQNWQKAIGGHRLWVDAMVIVAIVANGIRAFHIRPTLHMEDMYNFNPGDKDIVTGIPDARNGRFQITGLAHEFLTTAELSNYHIKFDLNMSLTASSNALFSNIRIEYVDFCQ